MTDLHSRRVSRRETHLDSIDLRKKRENV